MVTPSTVEIRPSPAGSRLRIAVVSPGKGLYSETFIQAHVDRLSGQVEHLHGDVLPLWRDSGAPLPPRALHLAARLIGRAMGRDPRSVVLFLGRQFHGRSRERSLARYLVRRGVDVILAEFGYTGVAMAPVAARAGIPLVVHFHGWDAYQEDVLARYREGYRRLFRQASTLVAVSSDMVEQLVQLGAIRDRIRLNPYGVDVLAFSPATPVARPTFLAVGRFVEKKAPHLTILAFCNVAKAEPTATLHMVGDGPLLGACRSLVHALQLSDRVTFHAALPHVEIREHMRSAMCFVQHSIRASDGDSEGSPVSVIEAMASGLPVVATRHAGIAESVVHGTTGYLVEEKDTGAMGEYMIELARNPAVARRMGSAGRERAVKHYRLDRSLDGLVTILRESTLRRAR